MKWARATVLWALLATAAHADALPLKPGTFVLEGQPCDDPPLAAMFQYDGRQFSYPHASRCRAMILSHHGRSYRQRETCSALGDGTAATPTTTVSRYDIPSPTRVEVRGEGRRSASTYRWCSPR